MMDSSRMDKEMEEVKDFDDQIKTEGNILQEFCETESSHPVIHVAAMEKLLEKEHDTETDSSSPTEADLNLSEHMETEHSMEPTSSDFDPLNFVECQMKIEPSDEPSEQSHVVTDGQANQLFCIIQPINLQLIYREPSEVVSSSRKLAPKMLQTTESAKEMSTSQKVDLMKPCHVLMDRLEVIDYFYPSYSRNGRTFRLKKDDDICKICSKKFHKKYIVKHLKQLHLREHLKPCDCKICGINFNNIEQKKSHIIKFHPNLMYYKKNEKLGSVNGVLYTCEICFRSFINSRIHFQKYHFKKLSHCDLCNVDFKNFDEEIFHFDDVHCKRENLYMTSFYKEQLEDCCTMDGRIQDRMISLFLRS